MESELEDAGFIDAEETVTRINALEKNVAQELNRQNKYFLAAFASIATIGILLVEWPKLMQDDVTGENLWQIFLNEIEGAVSKLTLRYVEDIDPLIGVSKMTQRTTAWAEQWSKDLSEYVQNTTHKDIERLLVEHLKEGKSIEDFISAIKDSGIRDEYLRARKIANNEILRAHSVAKHEALIQCPSVDKHAWKHTASQKGEPRPYHVELSNEPPIPKNERFTLLGEDGGLHYPLYPRDSVLPPGESINCHCIEVGIISDDITRLSLEEQQAL